LRTLKFIVDGNVVERDPACDFGGLIPGAEQYLRVEFSFSPEWIRRAKVARFWSPLGHEYEPQVLKDGRSCLVPAEALKKRKFKMQIMGKIGESKMLTNKFEVIQNGGK
jgi:hypothetical protein